MMGGIFFLLLYALRLCGIGAVALLGWFAIQERRMGLRRALCIAAGCCVVFLTFWYFFPIQRTAGSSQRAVQSVLVEHGYGSEYRAVTLEGEDAAAFVQRIDPIRVRRRGITEPQGLRNPETDIYVAITYENKLELFPCNAVYLDLRLQEPDRSYIRFMGWNWYDDTFDSYLLCDPEPILAYLRPLLDL